MKLNKHKDGNAARNISEELYAQAEEMRLLIINILLLYSTHVWLQTDFEIGLVSIKFEDKTVLAFYLDNLDIKPDKVSTIFRT